MASVKNAESSGVLEKKGRERLRRVPELGSCHKRGDKRSVGEMPAELDGWKEKARKQGK